MLKNYLKIAWRSIIRDRQFTVLNLAGLAVGLACTILIYLWVSDELRMDTFHEEGDRLYEVMHNVPLGNDQTMTTEHTPALLANALKQEVPGIEEAVSMTVPDPDENNYGIISDNEQSFRARELFVSDNFFNVFTFQLIEGNRKKVLSEKFNILLSDQLASKLFHNSKNIIGKTITWYRGKDNKVNGSYIIAGIFKTPPTTSSLQFDVLFTHQLYVATSRQDINWHSSDPLTYIMLKKGVNVEQVNKQVKDFIISKTGSKEDGTLFLQRYSDKYLHGNYENGRIAGGRIEYVKLFSVIAIFLLVIACINFMNLSTAKSSRRLKEVGIRKVVGAGKSSLIFQYMGESMLMAILSMLLALLLVALLLPAFNEITGKKLIQNFNISFILAILSITLITGIIAGSYPALYLSRFKPVLILKGKLNTSVGESWIRRGLVVFQFSISVILLVSVLVIYRQMQLIQTKNLGFKKDNIIRFSSEGVIQQNLQGFLSAVKSIPGVTNATDMQGDMLGNHSGGGGINWPGKTQRIEFSGLYVDFDFMETMGLQMKDGRLFSRKFGTDMSGVIFNETAIDAMGLKDPVGKTVNMWGRERHIIGVVKDFHFESLYNKIGPFFLCYQGDNDNVLVKVSAGKTKEALAGIENLFRKYNQGLPFNYTFLDEDYRKLYASEQRVSVLSRYFAGIAIIISCLGLFGLAAFTAQRRQKEIGIRKVVGATVTNVAFMLSGDFLKLVVIAILIAMPVAWWAVNQWLQGFAYRMDPGAGVFLISGGLMIFITLLTVSFQAIKAGLANPVKSLRME